MQCRLVHPCTLDSGSPCRNDGSRICGNCNSSYDPLTFLIIVLATVNYIERFLAINLKRDKACAPTVIDYLHCLGLS